MNLKFASNFRSQFIADMRAKSAVISLFRMLDSARHNFTESEIQFITDSSNSIESKVKLLLDKGFQQDPACVDIHGHNVCLDTIDYETWGIYTTVDGKKVWLAKRDQMPHYYLQHGQEDELQALVFEIDLNVQKLDFDA